MVNKIKFRYYFMACTVMISQVVFSQYQWGSISIKLGSDLSLNYQEIGDMQANFSNATFLHDDFSSYSYDSSVYQLFGFPVTAELNFNLRKVNQSDRFLDKLEYNFFIGYSERQIGYDNRVSDSFTPNPGSEIEGKIHREQYEFFWYGSNFYLGSEVILKGKERGKCRPYRFGYGLRLAAGLSSSRVTSYHLSGNYYGKIQNFGAIDASYQYFFPPINYSEEVFRSEKVNSISTLYGFVCGFEQTYGAKKRFILGFDARIGGYLMINPKGFATHNSTIGAVFSLGYAFGAKE